MSDFVSLSRLKELLDFDAATGVFRWRGRRLDKFGHRYGRILSGQMAGCIHRIDGRVYRYIRVDGRVYLSSRLAWFYVRGEWPKAALRFLDGNGDNVRLDNLAELPGATGRFNGALFRTYGISEAEYWRLHDCQNGLCAICQKPETATRKGTLRLLCVDHEHKTGKVRGLLCNRCNRTIGYMGENPGLLRAAAVYLDSFTTNITL